MRNSYTAPTAQAVGKSLKKSEADSPFKTIIAEKIPAEWGLGDAIEDLKEQGFEIVNDGPRRVTMQMPMDEFKKRTKQVWDTADQRMRSTEGMGKVRTTVTSEKQMAETLPDVSDLDE